MSTGEPDTSEVLSTLQAKGDSFAKMTVIEKKRLADLEDAIEHISVETDKYREKAKKSAIDVMNLHILTPNPAYQRADGVSVHSVKAGGRAAGGGGSNAGSGSHSREAQRAPSSVERAANNQHKRDDETHHGKRRVLADERLARQVLCPRGVLPALVRQVAAHRAHVVQPLPLPQHVLNVACHDALDLHQILAQFADVALRARVQVQLLGALDDGVELNERVPAMCAREARVRPVRHHSVTS